MLDLGPFMVTWHGLLTAVGLVVSVYAARSYARRFGIDPDMVWWLAPYVIVAAVVGGRLAYIAANLADFRLNPLDALRIDRGGLGSFGALLATVAVVYLLARRRGLSPWRLADALAIAIPVNYLAMRVGSFLIGELYGDPTGLPWAVTVPGVAGARHPVPLYDALAQITLIAAFVRRARAVPFDGFLLWWTLFYASIIRFAVDLFRSEWRTVGPFTLGQLGALGLAVLAAAALAVGRRRAAAVHGDSP